MILEAAADEETDEPVGHINDRLDRTLRCIVVREESQLFDEFNVDGFPNKVEEASACGVRSM